MYIFSNAIIPQSLPSFYSCFRFAFAIAVPTPAASYNYPKCKTPTATQQRTSTPLSYYLCSRAPPSALWKTVAEL